MSQISKKIISILLCPLPSIDFQLNLERQTQHLLILSRIKHVKPVLYSANSEFSLEICGDSKEMKQISPIHDLGDKLLITLKVYAERSMDKISMACR